MSTSSQPQLSSFNALRRAHQPPRLCPDAKRLFWTLDGPLPDSIWIMKDAHNPDSLEVYSQDSGWHPASESPLTEPKVSSITVHTDDLNTWEDQWLDYHRDHSDPDEGDEGYDADDGDDHGHGDGNTVQWGALPDYDPDKDEEGPKHLLVCCGTRRPRAKAASIEVKPSASSFVTVHDYVSTVHPWLMNLRGDILAAMGLWDDKPLSPETKLMVNYNAPDCLKMYDQATWVCLTRKQSNPLLVDAISLQQGRATETGQDEKKMQD